MAKRSIKWHEKLEKAVFSDDESKVAYEAFAYNMSLQNIKKHHLSNSKKIL